MTNTFLIYISKEISAGRPLWALLRFNEYQHTASGIRKALCGKASKQMTKLDYYKNLSGIIEQVVAGKRLAEFSDIDKKRIRNFRENPSITSKKFSFEMTARTSYGRRRDALLGLRAQNG